MTPRPGVPTIRSRWPAILWILAIFVVSSVPGPALSKVGFSVLGVPVPDKLAHLVEYGVLGALLGLRSMALGRGARHAWLRSVLWVLCIGAIDETYQRFTPGREHSVADWVADGLGASLGAALAILGWRIRRARRGATPPFRPAEEER